MRPGQRPGRWDKQQFQTWLIVWRTWRRAGMEEAVTCVVCNKVYEKGPREPLVLPCGHTFCRSCLNHYDSCTRTQFYCPTCRTDFSHLKVDDLPLCFSLLGLSATYMESQCNTCSKHGDELKYWCLECKVALCSLCLYSEHENGHHVHLAKAYIEERKYQLMDQIELIIFENIAEKKEEIRNIFYNSSRMISTLCLKSTFLHDFEENMKILLSEIEKVCSIGSLFVSEAKVKHIEMSKLNSLLSRNDSTEVEVTRECAASAEGKAGAVTAAEGKTEAAEAATQKQQQKQRQAPPANSQCVKLDYRDGRLLLHSQALCVDSPLFLKLPSEVFLELGVGSRSLGRVYIRVQPRLRHSQQFLLLCLGTLGPSLAGSAINSVNHIGQDPENILVNSYIDKMQIGNTNVLASLETSCDMDRSTTEGTVTSANIGSNIFGFMIWTKGHPFNSCPYVNVTYNSHYYGYVAQNNSSCNNHFHFGEVTSGLEVVQAAIGHNPITEVKITGCGLSIPDL
ncbi:tripartite motif-containing protein 5 isoform X3 [Procambarus clarkii]|uniref:tripartite motif-containing protein 5 isoform X3 n=1 Tax=Procambarus clarkii TaxID=6728 RepID=UPI003742C0A9